MTAYPPAEQPPDPDSAPPAEHANPSHDADRGTTRDELKDSAAAAFPKLIAFDSLCRCGDEVWIENHGVIYRLRRTRQGKLILTK